MSTILKNELFRKHLLWAYNGPGIAQLTEIWMSGGGEKTPLMFVKASKKNTPASWESFLALVYQDICICPGSGRCLPERFALRGSRPAEQWLEAEGAGFQRAAGLEGLCLWEGEVPGRFYFTPFEKPTSSHSSLCFAAVQGKESGSWKVEAIK